MDIKPCFTQASSFSLLASLILVILSAGGGYLLGGLGGSKWVQALGAGQHNIAAAMVVATMNFGSQEIVMVVVYSLITMIIMTPLSLELGKRAKAAEAAGATDAATVSA